MIIGCNNEECTVDQTGICMLNHEPEHCPDVVSSNDSEIEIHGGSEQGDPSSETTEEVARFPPSLALGLDNVRQLMRKEQCHLIGLIGEPNSGKTACLVSLYLLLSRNRLEGFTFADSKSLMGLDQLSRGSRSWPGQVPEEMTAHTELTDDRRAGFLHFKIVREHDRSRLNLLVPDLPGEWTTSLIDSNRTDRLGFLRSADSLWLMIDGQTLSCRVKRQGAIHRAAVLIDRLAAHLRPNIPNLHLVVSRYDVGEAPAEALQEIRSRAERSKVVLSVRHIASFSTMGGMSAGEGIASLVAHTVEVERSDEIFWPEVNDE